MKRLVVFAGLILFGTLGIWGYLQNNVSGEAVYPKRGEISPAFFASGTVRADRQADLAFATVGRITYLPVEKGDTVAAGQVVAALDTRDTAAAKEQAMLTYMTTRWNYEQTKANYQNQAVTDAQRRTLDQSQFALDSSVKSVEIADRAIGNSALYAPFTGLVTEVNGQLNEWVGALATKPLVTVTDLKSIIFEAEVEEGDVSKLSAGLPGEITLDAFPDRKIPTTVIFVNKSSVIKPNGDTVLPVKLSLDMPDQYILGLNGDAKFILPKKETLTLPTRAVTKKDNISTVTVKNGMFAKTVRVKTGISDSDLIEILSGVNERDRVIIPPQTD